MGKKGIAFFSGGKDSVFAIWKAKKSGIPVDYLLFNTHDFPRPNVHEVNFDVVQAVAALTDLKFYTLHLEEGKEYLKLGNFFSKLSIESVVVGCINSEEQLSWYEDLCNETGTRLYAPIWSGGNSSSKSMLVEEISSGIKAIICDLDMSKLSESLLGRVIDKSVIEELPSSVDPCGESGEYHTLVIEAPILSGRIVLNKFSMLKGWNRYMLKVENFKVERNINGNSR